MALEAGEQLLKTRDDRTPVRLITNDAAHESQTPFKLAAGADCSWARPEQGVGPEILRPRIEPWLTALVQSEHLSLLIGSGLTNAVHSMATGHVLAPMDPAALHGFDASVVEEAKRTARLAGRDEGNVEDLIRVASELLRGLEILSRAHPSDSPTRQQAEALRATLSAVLSNFANSILGAERGLLGSDPQRRERAFAYLVSLLMSFASRSGTRERLHLFTINYDRFLEAGADAAGLQLMDRFVGTLAPVFRASRLDVDLHYNPPGIRGEPRYLEGVAHFTKLHGSLDWLDCDRNIRRIALPFAARDLAPYLAGAGLADAHASRLMIYPNSAKDRETAAFPFVELFRDFAAAVCRPNSTLVSFGYSFGDEHINRVIEDMLTIPSAHLVIIAMGDPLGRILDTFTRLGRQAQVTLLLGDHLGALEPLVDHYLPKPAIDRTTFRMAEILKARWSASQGHIEGAGTATDAAGEQVR